MKITSVTPSSAKPTAYRARLRLLGLLLILGGGYLLFQVAQVQVLTCSRTAAAVGCSLKNSIFSLLPLQQTDVAALQSAFVGETCDRRGCSYRVELAHPGGIIPLSSLYTSGRASKDALVSQIKEYLQDSSAPPLAVWQTSGIMEMGLPLALIAAGALLLLLTLRSPRADPTSQSPEPNTE